ncbi:NKG2-A/NKG2-B type II integral membrane protein-like isoform X5 [Grammomys surdaster]|uniref:NKG2-A/NKG2-B type II integral membrane protein-like isoform X5 n=1 Tax=Grammomys surdaster TaxID=491861 RepID=UPI00109EF7CB|nr:NKG2-A/NKG2-B type II integral membrane protein-like isoform X5 [Grammomys surdaster]
MSNERVTYAELNVAKNSKNQHRKPRGTCSSIPVIEQEIIYADFSFQNPSQEHPRIYRDCRCKGFPSPPEKLIAGTLGIICFVLIVALVVLTTVATPYTEGKTQINSSMSRMHRDINHNLSSAQPCAHCPKEWISYSHNCYYISVEKKSWSDGLVSCVSKNCSLLYIDSEEEMDFLESLSLVSWARVCQKSRGQPWVQIKDSTFNSQISETSHDEHDCIICIMLLSGSGLIADNCTALHTYICKCKLTN